MYNSYYSPQMTIDRINTQIAELEKLKGQIPQMQQPTNLTQNFQLAPTNRELMRYASSIEEIKKEIVIADTPYFAKDMSVVWIKNTRGEIKTYELNEIIPKDEKDIRIEFLQSQIEELKKEVSSNAKSNDDDVDEPTESKKSTNVSNGRSSKEKPKQSNGDA